MSRLFTDGEMASFLDVALKTFQRMARRDPKLLKFAVCVPGVKARRWRPVETYMYLYVSKAMAKPPSPEVLDALPDGLFAEFYEAAAQLNQAASAAVWRRIERTYAELWPDLTPEQRREKAKRLRRLDDRPREPSARSTKKRPKRAY